MELELHVRLKIQMDAMCLNIRKIKKYAIDNKAWYHYVVGSIVTLVVIMSTFVVAFRVYDKLCPSS